MTEAAISAPPAEAPSCLDAALEYLAGGFSVVPIKPGEKRPLLGSWRQYQKIMATEKEVREWYSEHPDAGVGIVTGENSGIVVVDVDGEKGQRSLQSLALDDAVSTPVAKTGNGSHIYFKHPGYRFSNSAGKIAGKKMPGIDIRGDGGIIVAPPSRHENGQLYDWVGGFKLGAIPLADLPPVFLGGSEGMQTLQATTNGSVSYANAPSGLEYTNDVGARERRYAEVALEKECALVASAGFGAQEDTLNKAALNIGNLVGAGVMEYGRAKDALVNAGLGMSNQGGREPWAFEDISKKVNHGLRDGMKQPRDLSAIGRDTQSGPGVRAEQSTEFATGGNGIKPNGANGTNGSGDAVAISSSYATFDPGVKDGSRRPAPRFPIELLGSPWCDFVIASAEASGAPVDYIAAILLTGAAALIGNSRSVSPWHGWKEPPVLWCAMVGNPSSGKTPALAQLKPTLHRIEDQWSIDFPDQLRKWQTQVQFAAAKEERWKTEVKSAERAGLPPPLRPEAADAPERPIKPRLIIMDATIEAVALLLSEHDRGLLQIRDEIAGWIGQMNKYGGTGDRPFWLETFGGGRYTVDRVRLSGVPIEVQHMTVSVLGGIQPDKLAEAVLGDIDDGFAARFMWIWPEPVPPRQPTNFPNDLLAEAALNKLAGLKAEGANSAGFTEPRIMPLSDEAIKLFVEWRTQNAADQSGRAGKLLSHFGKMDGMVLRLGLVLEHLHWLGTDWPEPTSIGRGTIQAAIDLVETYLKPMAERTFGDAELLIVERNAATLARWLLKNRPKIVNKRDLHRNVRLPGLREAKSVQNALNWLIDSGWLRGAPSRAGGTKGRSRSDFEVNPLAYE